MFSDNLEVDLVELECTCFSKGKQNENPDGLTIEPCEDRLPESYTLFTLERERMGQLSRVGIAVASV